MESTYTITQGSALPLSRQNPQIQILLVDDDPIFRSMTRLALLQLGHSVSVADDGKCALETAAQNNAFELLITDVVMPGMNGVELAAKFRAILPGCKVLYISGYSAEALAATGASVDSLHFLQKPFQRAQIDACIKAILAAA